MVLSISTFEELKNACALLKEKYLAPQVFALHGNLGSGKTTFVQHFIQEFSENERVTSPTYSLVNEYTIDEQLFLHYDLYRLNDIMEALNIGIEDYLERGDYHFIEWPEVIDEILPTNTVHLYFKNANFERTIEIKQ